jgi:hypothetical protein
VHEQPPGLSCVAPVVDPVTVTSRVVSATVTALARMSLAGAPTTHAPEMQL